MKTAIEVVKEIVLSHPVSMDNVQVEDFEGEEWSEILLPVMTDAMKAYAQQACEDLRERIQKEVQFNCNDIYTINTEIILP